MKFKNAKKEPEVFYALHMYEGVARYEDEDIFVSNKTIKSMCKSFEGKPIFVEHKDVPVEEWQSVADGYVSDCFYNENDGKFWTKFVAVSDEARDAISKGWAVSNAYFPTFSNVGGTWINVDYNREVIGGKFDHLAIVDNPRYEGAVIMTPDEYKAYNVTMSQELEALNNAKDEPKEKVKKSMFKLFKTEKVAVQNEADLDNAFASFEGAPEEGVSIAELTEAYKNAKKDEAVEEKEDKAENKCSYNMDDELEIDGKKVKFEELVNAYMKKKNADEEAEKEEEAKAKAENKAEEERKENAKAEAEEGKKLNDEMREAIQNGKEAISPVFASREDKLKKGREAY